SDAYRHRRRHRVGCIAPEQTEADGGAADTLARERQDGGFEVLTARIDPGRIAQAELEIDRSGDAHELADLVMADGSAEIVGRLDVEVDGGVDRLSNRGNLRQRE